MNIGFQLPNQSEVAIVVSKNAGKYRVMSSNYEGLLFIVSQICYKLNECYEEELKIYFEEELNYNDFFQVVENHYKMITEYKEKNQELEDYSTLYTAIQKSLLNKYKEKRPPSLNNLDFLLRHVHKSMLKLTAEMENLVKDIKLAFKDIIIWTESMCFFLKLKAKLDQQQYYIIKDVFPLDSLENLMENSWEDVTLANMANFFKFYYSKKDSQSIQEIKEIKELEKWKKYFKTIFDKIIKNNGF